MDGPNSVSIDRDRGGDLVRTPLGELADARRRIGTGLRNDSVVPARTRLRHYDEARRNSDELISMGDVYVASHGGSLRTFSGNLAHENGIWPSFKRRRLQHWEGMAQRACLMSAEVDLGVMWAQSEARRFEFTFAGRRRRYTCDVEQKLACGRRKIIELKRDENDLADEEYQLTLAGVAEICRRCCWVFEIIFAHEIFVSAHHRDNVELFQARRFARVGPEHVRRLRDFAASNGPETTYEDLSLTLEPNFQPGGAAVVQALLVRRMIEIDLRQPLYAERPVTIL